MTSGVVLLTVQISRWRVFYVAILGFVNQVLLSNMLHGPCRHHEPPLIERDEWSWWTITYSHIYTSIMTITGWTGMMSATFSDHSDDCDSRVFQEFKGAFQHECILDTFAHFLEIINHLQPSNLDNPPYTALALATVAVRSYVVSFPGLKFLLTSCC